jgi:cobalt/nickel transport system permease protein
MHIPDGFVSGTINLAGFGASAIACSYSIRQVNKTMDERHIPLLGVTSAFIFAAQMFNFPIGGGTSGHFLGALMAAILMGPWASCLIMSIVLTIQCLGFADGGITALGTNIFNMGIIGGLLSYYIFIFLKAILPKNRGGFLTSSAIASWFSVVASSIFCAIELDLSGTAPLKIVLPAMLGVHAIIGIGEAIITTAVLSSILSARSDLIMSWKEV